MQTTAGGKRFDLGQVKTVALLISLTAVIMAGAAAVAISRDDAATTAPAVTRSDLWIHTDEAYRLEQEMMLHNDLYNPGGTSDRIMFELPEEAIDARLRDGESTPRGVEPVESLGKCSHLGDDCSWRERRPLNDGVQLVPPHADRLDPTDSY